MLVPFAVFGGPEAREALETLPTLRLPRLQALLRRLAPDGSDAGAIESFTPPHERALARAWGLPVTDGLVPLAALQAAPGAEAGEGWAWITPCHWRVGRDRIEMGDPQQLALDDAASRTLLAAMQPWFAEDGITLAYDGPLRWLARGDLFRALPTASLDRAVGRTIDRWLPTGAAGRPLRRLQQEMQMLLYTLPLNDARERAGQLPVNSFWASGSGALPAQGVAAPADLRIAPQLRDALLAEGPAGWAAAWQALDEGEIARLQADLEAGREVRLTLCGESGARTWSSRAAGRWQRLAGWMAAPKLPKLLEGL